jgi:hypothetical protein
MGRFTDREKYQMREELEGDYSLSVKVDIRRHCEMWGENIRYWQYLRNMRCGAYA